ncbi:MAG: hypothetical protein B7733_23455 [Myxococcales bacterium FL481]|nr:MAG: hypothetical protein B7733_23455 [Myxococcales bacterium FL481]
MISRRNLLTTLSAAVVVGPTRGARAMLAANPSVPVVVPNHSVGAIVAAIAGKLASVTVDRSIDANRLVLAGSRHVEIAARIRVKGSGVAATRFLDDARNATTAAANIRDALILAAPQREAQLRLQHREWSRPFARRALRWTQALQRSSHRGARWADTYARVYLLEWTGVIVDASAGPSPASLAKLPAEPTSSTMAAYVSYIDELVRTMG